MEKINLEKLVGGSLQEKFTHSFRNVVENLQDPNTPYKNVREITIKLKFAQNEKRDDVKCDILVSEKLAPQAPMQTSFSVGTDLRTGEYYAKEYGKQLNGQLAFEDVKTETSEEDMLNENNVVDLRNVAAK